MRKSRITILLTLLFLLVGATPSQAECLEIKNDNLNLSAKNDTIGAKSVVPYRMFCQSEYFGSVFKFTQDLTIQKMRLLISGDNKNIMDGATFKLVVYEDLGKAVPGKELISEIPYAIPPGSINDAKPKWFELSELQIRVKKGQAIRIVFGHAVISCSSSQPSCPTNCNWASATTDSGPFS